MRTRMFLGESQNKNKGETPSSFIDSGAIRRVLSAGKHLYRWYRAVHLFTTGQHVSVLECRHVLVCDSLREGKPHTHNTRTHTYTHTHTHTHTHTEREHTF